MEIDREKEDIKRKIQYSPPCSIDIPQEILDEF
jgi:hypothetical protein